MGSGNVAQSLIPFFPQSESTERAFVIIAHFAADEPKFLTQRSFTPKFHTSQSLSSWLRGSAAAVALLLRAGGCADIFSE
jgi:hypothetical protein